MSEEKKDYQDEMPSDVEPVSEWDKKDMEEMVDVVEEPEAVLINATEEPTTQKRKTSKQIVAELLPWFKKWNRKGAMFGEFKDIYFG